MKKIALMLVLAMAGCDDPKPNPTPPPFQNRKLFTGDDGNVVHAFIVGHVEHYYVISPTGTGMATNEIRKGKVMVPDSISSCRCKPEAEKAK